jgi:hypothetical protein
LQNDDASGNEHFKVDVSYVQYTPAIFFWLLSSFYVFRIRHALDVVVQHMRYSKYLETEGSIMLWE